MTKKTSASAIVELLRVFTFKGYCVIAGITVPPEQFTATTPDYSPFWAKARLFILQRVFGVGNNLAPESRATDIVKRWIILANSKEFPSFVRLLKELKFSDSFLESISAEHETLISSICRKFNEVLAASSHNTADKKIDPTIALRFVALCSYAAEELRIYTRPSSDVRKLQLNPELIKDALLAEEPVPVVEPAPVVEPVL